MLCAETVPILQPATQPTTKTPQEDNSDVVMSPVNGDIGDAGGGAAAAATQEEEMEDGTCVHQAGAT